MASPVYEADRPETTMDVKYYTKWICRCGKSKRMDEAERVFREMESKGIIPNAFTYTAMMRGYHLAGNKTEVFNWFRRMRQKKIRPTLITLGTLLTTCAADGDIRQASKVLAEFRTLGLEPDITGVNALLKACIRAGDLDLTVRLFDQIEKLNLKKSLITYNTLINAYAQLGDHTNVKELLANATTIRKEIRRHGLKCDVQTFNASICLTLRVKKLRRALKLFAEMKAEDVQPDVVTYSTLIDGYAKLGRVHEKQKLFDKCSDLLRQMEKSGVHPNVYTYNSLMKVCVRIGNHSKALKIFDFMKRQRLTPDVATFGTLIDCHVKHSSRQDPQLYLQTCFCLLDEMKLYSLRPNCEIFSSLIVACANVADVSCAERLLEFMKKRGIRPNRVVYTSLMKVYLTADYVDKALRCLATMDKEGFPPNVYAFNSLLTWCVCRGNKKEAARTFTDMKSRGIKPNDVTTSLLLKLKRSRAITNE